MTTGQAWKEQPKTLGWGHHAEEKSLTHHAIISLGIDSGSVATGCNGRWPTRDSWSWFAGRDTVVFPKCGACVDYVNAERKREGLGPIRKVHRAYEVAAQFDLGGES